MHPSFEMLNMTTADYDAYSVLAEAEAIRDRIPRMTMKEKASAIDALKEARNILNDAISECEQ